MARALAVALLMTAVLAPPASAWYCYSSLVDDCNVAPPMALVAEASPDGIHLSWQEPVVGVVESYEVHRRLLDGEADAEHVANVGLERTYVDEPPAEGIYLYYVTSLRDGHRSPPSNPVVVSWPSCVPASVMPFGIHDNCLKPFPLSGDGDEP